MGRKKKKDTASFSEDDLWAEAHEAMQKKKEKVEKQVKDLVDEATELLEEAASIADKEGKEDAAASESETKTKTPTDKKVVLDAEPVATSPSSVDEAKTKEKKEEKASEEEALRSRCSRIGERPPRDTVGLHLVSCSFKIWPWWCF